MGKIYVMVSGSRHYTRYFEFAKKMDHILANFNKKDIVFVEGEAAGTDYLGFLYALRRGLKHIGYPADWDEHGKSAGYIRNVEMMEVAQFCIAFWDGKSRGTQHVVRNCHRYDVSLRTIQIEPENRHAKQRKGHGAWRKVDGATLSRYRKRRAAQGGPRPTEQPGV
jgi:hypothetical protein